MPDRETGSTPHLPTGGSFPTGSTLPLGGPVPNESALPNGESSFLQTVAQREAALLAPYAMRSSESRGRKHFEPAHPYRGPFQRDRDRIVHSAAYRRLSGKTQVFMGDMGDYHRTRLTHTYEVASIARTLGRTLRLNEDLIEALALFHDIGHPPFGHAGEDALNECLANAGGFSHNRFALTLAEELETRYPDFPGLNLTLEVLEGQTHRAHKDQPAALVPLLEVQIVDLADSITYDAHDADDAVKLGLVELPQLLEIPLVRLAADRVAARGRKLAGKLLRNSIVHELIDLQVTDVLSNSALRLQPGTFANSMESRQAGILMEPSASIQEQKRVLESFLFEHVYRHPRLLEVRSVAQQRLRQMFERLVQQPAKLPARFRERVELVGLERSVGDYIAGMTDRYCDSAYQRLLATT